MSSWTGWLTNTDWLAWLGLGGVAGLGVLWWLGLLPILIQVLGVVAEMARPIARVLGEWIGAVLRWLGRKVAAGLADIFDSFATVLTVSIVALGCYFGAKLADDVKYAKLDARYGQCIADLKKAKRAPSAVREPEFRLPWLW